MLAKRLVPCLDVDRGRVVKGVKFVSLRDAGDPVECAARYDAEGADELVFLDITASSDARPIVLDMVRRVADTVFLPFTVGRRRALRGGRRRAAARGRGQGGGEHRRRGRPGAARAAGARASARRRWCSPSTRARRPAARAGRSSCTAAARPPGRDAVAWAREGAERGAGEILLTSMDRDGTKDGFDVALTRAVADAVTRARGGLRRLRHRRAHGGGARRRAGQRRPGRLRLPLRRDPHPRRQGARCASWASRCGR